MRREIPRDGEFVGVPVWKNNRYCSSNNMVLDDNQKIGVGFIALGIGFIVLGILLFFDRSLIAIGNVLFLAGLCFAVGARRALVLFTRKERWRGTVCFVLGIILVLMRWGIVGICLEAFGFLNLFGNFLPIVLTVGRQIPGLKVILDFPVIAQAIDYLAGQARPKYSV